MVSHLTHTKWIRAEECIRAPGYLDVRTDKEYFNKASGKSAPDINAIHIPWDGILQGKGAAKSSGENKARLGQHQGGRDRIVLISYKGVRSEAAAYACSHLDSRMFRILPVGGIRWRVIGISLIA